SSQRVTDRGCHAISLSKRKQVKKAARQLMIPNFSQVHAAGRYRNTAYHINYSDTERTQKKMKEHSMGLAVITEASSGFGAVYADRFPRRGYDLLLVARNRERLNEVAKNIAI